MVDAEIFVKAVFNMIKIVLKMEYSTGTCINMQYRVQTNNDSFCVSFSNPNKWDEMLQTNTHAHYANQHGYYEEYL